MNMEKYTLVGALFASGYKKQEVAEMGSTEMHMAAVENNFRECLACEAYIHTDNFNGEKQLCDPCAIEFSYKGA